MVIFNVSLHLKFGLLKSLKQKLKLNIFYKIVLVADSKSDVIFINITMTYSDWVIKLSVQNTFMNICKHIFSTNIICSTYKHFLPIVCIRSLGYE
jgi:hypothetical protein